MLKSMEMEQKNVNHFKEIYLNLDFREKKMFWPILLVGLIFRTFSFSFPEK